MNLKGKDSSEWRKSEQELRPVKYTPVEDNTYDLYPAFPLGPDKIDVGFDAIAEKISNFGKVVIDGYTGVFWGNFRKQLNQALENKNLKAEWIDVSGAMLEADEIEKMVTPYLGGEDPIFGTRYTGELIDFFDEEKLKKIAPASSGYDLSILYGCGAALAGWDDALLMYADLPKNELQFRSRAQSVHNLGADKPDHPKKMYKRYYFVDWVVLNKHKEKVLAGLDWVIDEQQPQFPSVMSGKTFRNALYKMSKSSFRARPWFEPGTWGGQWCFEHIPQLPKEPVNYAWSFELITPENGITFTSNEKLLETSFDWLMYQENEAVLGECADTFKYEFPIRFDFLDTFDGGNLSVQCHPYPEFIKKEFGENYTQDETYYMLDCKPGAKVYLGFHDGIEPDKFRKELEQSAENNIPVEIDDYVQSFEANKHDLFLIPHGTIHCSGTDNMVLEISATPYIFTFKMYDWLRLDLDGKPRPINIERAFKNLDFDRQGNRVPEELISKPSVIKEGDNWKVLHFPTHEKHFYDVHRFEFDESVEAKTNGSCQVLSLVEGSKVRVETKNGESTTYHYAETFIVPAAAESYRIINEGKELAKVVTAFVKKDFSKILKR
ncbi:MAG: class I mannose-6-phosphate isomerase [Balneolaceae bacterium]